MIVFCYYNNDAASKQMIVPQQRAIAEQSLSVGKITHLHTFFFQFNITVLALKKLFRQILFQSIKLQYSWHKFPYDSLL